MNRDETYQIPEGTEIIHESDLKDHYRKQIVIPSSVRQIEEGSFAHGKEPMRIVLSDNPFYSLQDHFLIEKRTGKLITYADNSPVIHVPAGLSSISAWAFYECTIEQMTFSAEIPEIHFNALTTCRIREAVFSFWNAHVFFPRKDIRLRQYLLECFGNNGMFDFQRYDEGIYAGYTEPERIREITARLKWPYELSVETARDYRRILESNLNEAVRQLGNIQDTDTLHRLCDLSVINAENEEEVLVTLHSLSDLHAYMDLNQYLNHTGTKESFDFSI